MRVATIGNAADEISAGTSTSIAHNSGWPTKRTSHPFSPIARPLCIVAPMRESIRSVWSRLMTGSTIRVSPGAASPANSKADFTWAEATGEVKSRGIGFAAPRIAIGNLPLDLVQN